MDPLEKFLDRPRFYQNIDGLGELGGSVMCLGLALQLWLVMHSPADSVWHQASFLVLVALVLLIPYGTKAVKARITYPRTGFVECRKPVHTQAIAGALGGLATVALAIGFRRHWEMPALVSVAGLGFAAVCGYHFARAVRWKWVIVGAMAAVALALGLLPADVVGTLGSDPSEMHPGRARLGGSVLLCLMADGILLLISGGISFWLYFRHTEAPAQEGQ